MSPSAPRSRVVAGIDEAGLGPLLDPLAVGWSVFRLPEAGADPWRLLAPLVGKRAVGKRAHRRAKLVVADSKRVFQRTASGEQRLESTVLAFQAQLQPEGVPPRDPAAYLFGPLAPEPALLERHPWYGELPSLPLHLEPEGLELTCALLGRRMAERSLELLGSGVRLVPSGELNRSYGETNNKGATVWQHCAEVLGHLWRTHGEEGPEVTVDILGGRSHYGALLAKAFPDARVTTEVEGPLRAAYRLDETGRSAQGRWLPRRMAIEFLAKGEDASFAVALASCNAKYARELVMGAFNRFFAARQPDLAPTAGYTTDGRRWLEEARPAIQGAGIGKDILVRQR